MNFWLAWIFSGGERDLFFDGESTKIRLLPGLDRATNAIQNNRKIVYFISLLSPLQQLQAKLMGQSFDS